MDMQRLGGLNSSSLASFRTLQTNNGAKGVNPAAGIGPTPVPSSAPIPNQRVAGGQGFGQNVPSAKPSPRAMFRSADAAPAMRRNKKRKTQDRLLNPRVEQFVPESKVYARLLEFERRLDSVIDSRKAEIQEALQAPERVSKKLRVYLHNTFANQPSDENRSQDDPPSWTLRVFGRVVDAGEGTTPESSSETSAKTTYPPFSHFIQKLEVQLDPKLYPGAEGCITWEKPPGGRSDEKDSFEVCRMGEEDVHVKISLYLDAQPPKFKLKAELASVLGFETATRTRVISALWAYICVNKLQNPDDPSIISCDDKLKGLFGDQPTVAISTLSQRLAVLLAPCDAVFLDYVIKVSGENPTLPEAFDVDIELPAIPHVDRLAGFLDKLNKDKEVEGHDQKILAAVNKIDEHRRRRAFFLGFSSSPCDFINTMLASQARELRVAKTSGGQALEVERQTEYFKGGWVEDAVVRYLQRRTAAGH